MGAALERRRTPDADFCRKERRLNRHDCLVSLPRIPRKGHGLNRACSGEFVAYECGLVGPGIRAAARDLGLYRMFSLSLSCSSAFGLGCIRSIRANPWRASVQIRGVFRAPARLHPRSSGCFPRSSAARPVCIRAMGVTRGDRSLASVEVPDPASAACVHRPKTAFGRTGVALHPRPAHRCGLLLKEIAPMVLSRQQLWTSFSRAPYPLALLVAAAACGGGESGGEPGVSAGHGRFVHAGGRAAEAWGCSVHRGVPGGGAEVGRGGAAGASDVRGDRGRVDPFEAELTG